MSRVIYPYEVQHSQPTPIRSTRYDATMRSGEYAQDLRHSALLGCRSRAHIVRSLHRQGSHPDVSFSRCRRGELVDLLGHLLERQTGTFGVQRFVLNGTEYRTPNTGHVTWDMEHDIMEHGMWGMVYSMEYEIRNGEHGTPGTERGTWYTEYGT